jgi:glutathione synthase/RimK-type ligase-like ATP-grasp enzyme
MVCVFAPPDIDLANGTVCAYVYEGSRWEQAILPIPAVIYNRISTRGCERGHLPLLQSLTTRGYHVFNSRFINKPEVYEALCGSWKTASCVPRTTSFTSHSLSYFTGTHSAFFLKPVASALGKGIFKVSWDGRRWWCHQQRLKEIKSSPLDSVQALKDHLQQITGGRRYLIQEAVDLPGWDGRVFDIRCLIQKNGEGQWRVVGMGARVSSKGRYLTHVPNGGEVWTVEDALNRSLGKYDLSRVEKVLVDAAEVLDSKLGLNLGILTADIGLGKEGRPYILEMNSKPWRFDENVIRQTSHQFLLDYVFYLECMMLETGGSEAWPR